MDMKRISFSLYVITCIISMAWPLFSHEWHYVWEPNSHAFLTLLSPRRIKSISWSTNSYQVDPDANALRWGTLYNFRFDARACPGSTAVTLELFKPGVSTSITVTTTGPEIGNVGDFTENCVLDLQDLFAFTTCLAGPGVELPAGCMDGDFNNDARIDLQDAAALQLTFAGS